MSSNHVTLCNQLQMGGRDGVGGCGEGNKTYQTRSVTEFRSQYLGIAHAVHVVQPAD
jgi:hypothetical protein